MDEGFVVRFYRPFISLLLLLCIMLSTWCFYTAGAFGGASANANAWVGWLGGLVFAAVAFGWLDRFLDTGVQIVVNRQGIRARRWSRAPIPWDQIERIEIQRLHGPRFLCLFLRNSAPFQPASFPARWIAKQNRWIGLGDVSIALTGTDHAFDDLLHAVRAYGPPGLLQER